MKIEWKITKKVEKSEKGGKTNEIKAKTIEC